MNSTWVTTFELANQRARKVLFTCVYILISDIPQFQSSDAAFKVAESSFQHLEFDGSL